MADGRLSGGCQCGAVRYSIPQPGKGVHLCHCRMCQKATGNLFAALAPVPREAVKWTRGRPQFFRSSRAAERGFCPHCGTPLSFSYVGGPTFHVTIGSLDTPNAVKPEIHYGVEARIGFLCLSDGLPEEATDDAEVLKRFPGFKTFQHPDHDTARWPEAG